MPSQFPAVRQPTAPVQQVPRPGGAATLPQPVNIPQIPGTPQNRLRSGGGQRVINNN